MWRARVNLRHGRDRGGLLRLWGAQWWWLYRELPWDHNKISTPGWWLGRCMWLGLCTILALGDPFWSHGLEVGSGSERLKIKECPMCKRRSVYTGRRAGNWNVSPKYGVAAGGLAQGAMTQILASPVGGRTETHAAGAMNLTAGWGMAALVREPVGGERYGGACYTGSVSPDHLVEGAAADEAQVVGPAWGYGGGFGVAHRISSTTAACSSSLLRRCERVICLLSCQNHKGIFLGC